jgi:hypothetical protein
MSKMKILLYLALVINLNSNSWAKTEANTNIWRDSKTGLTWGEVLIDVDRFGWEKIWLFDWNEANKVCLNYGKEMNLHFRLPTISEAREAHENGIFNHTYCGRHYDFCSDYWFWTDTEANYKGLRWGYSLSRGEFSIMGISELHNNSPIRCVSE